MIKGLNLFIFLCAVGIWALSASLTNYRILAFLAPLGDQRAAQIEHLIGEAYYSCGVYRKASFYFGHIVKDYPNSDQAEAAYFYWLESKRLGHLISPADLISRCQDYLDRFPTNVERERMVRGILRRNVKLMENQADFQPMGLHAGLQQMPSGFDDNNV